MASSVCSSFSWHPAEVSCGAPGFKATPRPRARCLSLAPPGSHPWWGLDSRAQDVEVTTISQQPSVNLAHCCQDGGSISGCWHEVFNSCGQRSSPGPARTLQGGSWGVAMGREGGVGSPWLSRGSPCHTQGCLGPSPSRGRGTFQNTAEQRVSSPQLGEERRPLLV